MNHRFAFCLVAALFLLGCGTSHDDHGSAESPVHTYSGAYPMKVLCTTGQVGEMLRRVGGQFVEVEALMGPGVDPHLFRPVNSDVNKLHHADAIFYNGLHLEGRMTDLFEEMAHTKATFAVTSKLVERKDPRLRKPPEFEGMYDPHVWHDVTIWSGCVGDVAEMLGQFDPPHAEAYLENAKQYLAELSGLDQFCRDAIAKIPAERRVLITAHDAFAYFGRAYGLEVYGLKGVSTDAEKDLEHQEELLRMIISRKIPAIFVESAVPKAAVEALIEPCRAAGWDVKNGGELYADALGIAGSDAEDYAGMIRHNASTISTSLGSEAP